MSFVGEGKIRPATNPLPAVSERVLIVEDEPRPGSDSSSW